MRNAARLWLIIGLGAVLAVGFSGCERGQKGQDVNWTPLPVESTASAVPAPPAESSETPAAGSPLADLPLTAALNRTDKGYTLNFGEAYNPFIQLTLHLNNQDYVAHVIRRTDEQADWTLYRQDLAVVYPDSGEVRIYPLTNAYITDMYSIDSLGYAGDYKDDFHLVFPLATGDEPGEASTYQIVSMDVRTGEREVLFDRQPEAVQSDFYSNSWVAYNGNGARFAVNSSEGGLWVYDLEKQTGGKLNGEFRNPWPIFALYPSPEGNLFWYGTEEALRLFDLEGKELASFSRTEGYDQYPPIKWSVDGEYAIYPYTFEQTDDTIIHNEGEWFETAPQGIRVFDRYGKEIRDLRVAKGSKRHLEIAGWFPANGLAVLHEYELDRPEGAAPRKARSVYTMLDVQTGVKTALKQVPIEQLKRTFAMKNLAVHRYLQPSEVILVDPDTKQFWISDRPAQLFDYEETEYKYWVATSDSAPETVIYRYSLEARELMSTAMDRNLYEVDIHGDWLIDREGAVVNYTNLDKLNFESVK